MLLLKVWGYDSEAVENNVEVYVGFLRKKLDYLIVGKEPGSKVEKANALGIRIIYEDELNSILED